ncbi:MAG: ABC transporter substrate-binding protein [Acidobacteria bacterium]|nr:ABC transporter substrate-binding protein [Acidobacteriota bacterium]
MNITLKDSRRLRVGMVLLAGVIMASPAAAQTGIPVKVEMGDVSINKIPFLIALDEGLFAKYGLAVDMVPFGANAADVHQIKGREKHRRDIDADIRVGGGAPMIVGRANRVKPSDDIILATTDHIVHWDIVARKGIESLEDLKGKRISYSGIGACSHYLALLIAEKMKWDPERDIVLLGGDYSVFPLKNGWTDALIAYEVPFAMARAEGYKSLVNLRSWNAPIACSGVTASRAWAAKNRETVISFLKAVTEAIAMMKTDKAVAFKAIEKWYGFTDSEVKQIIYNGSAEMERKPYPAIEGIKKAMQLYDSAAMRRFKPEDFYDSSYMKVLDGRGFLDKLYGAIPGKK